MHDILLAAALLAATPTLRWPLEHDDGLAASFGELRGDRVHMGIDLRTREIGMPVHAIDAGKVVRVKEQWRGYGLAVYIEHASGLVSVYGHLDRVAPDLEARLDRARRDRGSRWAGDVEVTDRAVKRGEVFAWSGETGAGLPHLHLEVRRGMGASLDPFAAGLEPPEDPSPPVAEELILIPMGLGATVDGDVLPVALPLHLEGGVHRATRRPTVAGPFDLILRAHDTAGATNHAGLGGFATRVDGRAVWGVTFDAIPYGDSRTSGAVLDLGRSHLSPTWYGYRVNGLLGGDIPYARGTPGPLVLAPGEHAIEIELNDVVTTLAPRSRVRLDLLAVATSAPPAPPAGSPYVIARRIEAVPLASALRVIATAESGAAAIRAQLGDRPLTLLPARPDPPPRPAGGPARYFVDIATPETGVVELHHANVSTRIGVARLAPDRALDFAFTGLNLRVASGVAWAAQTLVFRDLQIEVPEGLAQLAPIISISPSGHPLRGDGVVSFDVAVGRKAAVYEYDEGSRDFDFLDLGTRAEVSHVGTFALLDDRAPPAIGAITPARDAVVESRDPAVITAVVDDIGTGIPERGVSFTIDGTTLDVLYDPDRDLARASWSATPGEHRLAIHVSDRAGNVTAATHRFRVESRGKP